VSRNEKVPLQSYGETSEMVSLSNSNLYNAMIYPFTRMVIYGAIWYQGNNKSNIDLFVSWYIYLGESNAGYNADKYACTFAKMIGAWRQTWNQRTNGITDVQFPFGFVQVNFSFLNT
jgi:hypothetical protein